MTGWHSEEGDPKDVLKKFTTVQIAKALDEPLEFVERIVWNSGVHPDWSDEEILNVFRER